MSQNYYGINLDNSGILVITLNDPGGPVNIMNTAFTKALAEILERIETEKNNLKGVILTSAKNTFFAGGDLEEILAVNDDNKQKYYNKVEGIKADLRRLETLGIPVVAAINGAALGGGFEVCLACHHRIAIDKPNVKIGLPEVTLGLLPGGGGVIRLVRKLGLEMALPLLLDGTALNVKTALNQGLVDAVVPNRESMIAKAKAWIMKNPNARQPWDKQGYIFPGGDLQAPNVNEFIENTKIQLEKRKRNLYPAPLAILSCAIESMRSDLDTASATETEHLVDLAGSQVAKNMITTFFQMNRLKAGESRPKGIEKSQFSKIGILGAGMMGTGIAYCAAQAGLNVVLKDVSEPKAGQGKTNAKKLWQKQVDAGKLSKVDMNTFLSRIIITGNAKDLADCELIIEAVFENRELKAEVTREVNTYLENDAIFASNTSTLPISGLAKTYSHPENFIGLHFFSPVDRMQLVEIICGEKTSDETLARAYDFVRQLRKIPIVVSDSRDFYTSRVFESGCDEGAWLLSDGVNPIAIENLAKAAGMPVGPLTSVDAVSQQLVYSVKSQARKDFEAAGDPFPAKNEPPYIWVSRLVEEYGRKGKVFGAGYYDYGQDENGNATKTIWSKLLELQPIPGHDISDQDVKDRILFRQCIEAVRCLEEGVLRNVIDCNIGSMLGIGFPLYTGGQLQYINAYGVKKFTERAQVLAEKFGPRFTPPKMLSNMSDQGLLFE